MTPGKIFATSFYLRRFSVLLTRILAIAFAVFIVSAPAGAQLGPKDGADLAPTDLNRIKVGQPAPDFTLEAADGKPISLSDFRGKKSVVLVFYRGYW
jgi:cytochrome oxidase Cu insertion factor (SCO1/SenC/PrrC family)